MVLLLCVLMAWIQLGNESTSICCVSCGQVLLVVVAVRVSGVYY